MVVPEIEAIATDTLVALEAQGLRVVPTARAARLTMDREGIRRLAAETLGVPTSPGVPASVAEHPRDYAARVLGGLSDDVLAKVLHDTAADVYHMN